MKSEVLGTGCPECMSMEQNVKKALAELSLPAVVEKMTDIQQIIQRGYSIGSGWLTRDASKVWRTIPRICRLLTNASLRKRRAEITLNSLD